MQQHNGMSHENREEVVEWVVKEVRTKSSGEYYIAKDVINYLMTTPNSWTPDLDAFLDGDNKVTNYGLVEVDLMERTHTTLCKDWEEFVDEVRLAALQHQIAEVRRLNPA